jgi:hypothetical protein
VSRKATARSPPGATATAFAPGTTGTCAVRVRPSVVRRIVAVLELTFTTMASSRPGTVTRWVGASPASTVWIARVRESITATLSRRGLAT